VEAGSALQGEKCARRPHERKGAGRNFTTQKEAGVFYLGCDVKQGCPGFIVSKAHSENRSGSLAHVAGCGDRRPHVGLASFGRRPCRQTPRG